MITVYVDVLFLINFSVDYIVLTLTGSVFHYHVKRWRELLTAFLLSLYSLWALLLCGSYLLLFITAVASVASACAFTYGVRGKKTFVCTLFVFSGLSALFAGIIDVLFRFMGTLTGNLSHPPDGRQVLIFAGLAAVSSLLIKCGNKLLEPKRGVRCVDVSVELCQKTFRGNLFVDSGNMVIEPLSGRRVIFLTRKYAERQGIVEYINNNEEFQKFKRVVCIETASGKKAIDAYLCNKIMLTNKTVVGAIAITNDICEGEYDGIFPAALL